MKERFILSIANNRTTTYNDKVKRYLGFTDGHSTCKQITFQITSQCNLCCDYCYENHKGNQVMTIETARKIVDNLVSTLNEEEGFLNKHQRGIVLEFIGGEPLLYPNLIRARI